MSRFSADTAAPVRRGQLRPARHRGQQPVRCSSALLAAQPSPIITGRAEFAATVAFNRRFSRNCRFHTGPLYDHLDTLSTVRDLDALRAALGERTLTFHGSSYGTLLGQQYAEVFPRRIRALVLESLFDHKPGHPRVPRDPGRHRAGLLRRVRGLVRPDVRLCPARAGRPRGVGRSAGPGRARRAGRPVPARNGAGPVSRSSVLAHRKFYDPAWAELAQILRTLENLGGEG
jgi:pimeloyl-ACP methyl ester carboxylesterase